uniref:OPA3-like protein n=1 Tax=Ornithodoros turicata TaxID=34597 RepID=A0A2R5LHP4_9ACAR
MVVGAFPIAKLATLAFRQLSKPLANRLKSRAKTSPFFRNYICMPPAQLYHWVEVNVKMRLLNLGKPSDVPRLNEAMAIELGAELLGEMIIFTSAALTLVAEYVRQSRNERSKEHAKEEKYCCLEHEVEDLRFIIEKHEAEIRHLTRMYDINQRYSKSDNNNGGKDKSDHPTSGSKDEKVESKVDNVSSAVHKAADDVSSLLGKKSQHNEKK